MSIEEKLRLYAQRCNLTEQDVEFVLSLMREAVETERRAGRIGIGETRVRPVYPVQPEEEDSH